MKCCACQEEIQIPDDVLKCSGDCEGHYHFYCGGLTEDVFRKCQDKKVWKCLGCNTRRKPATNQPIVLESETFPSNPNPDVNSHPILNEIKDLKSFIKAQFGEYSKSLNHQEDIVRELTTVINYLKNEVKIVKEENATLKSELSRNKAEIELLKSETLELQQYSRRSNLEISDFPEVPSEDTKQVVTSILQALNLNNQDSVLVAHRVPSSRKDRHKAIIVQFTTKNERDRCLRASKEKHFLASDINQRLDSTPVYLNEHLAPGMKRLLFLSKQFKREKNFKFCWVRDGKIFLRQNENSRVFKVRKESDLSDIPILQL